MPIGVGFCVIAVMLGLAASAAAAPPTPTPAPPPGYGCDGAQAPAPMGMRGVGALDEVELEQAVRAHTRLALGRIAPQHRRNAPFTLGQDLVAGFGKRPEDLPVVVADCALRVGLPLVRDGELVGRLRVGLCDRSTELTDAQRCTMRALLAQAVRQLDMGPDSRMAGLPPLLERRDELVVEYFPLVLRSRGLALFYTAIATAPTSRYAVIVQVDGEQPCADVAPALGCAGLADELVRLATVLGQRMLVAAP